MLWIFERKTKIEKSARYGLKKFEEKKHNKEKKNKICLNNWNEATKKFY